MQQADLFELQLCECFPPIIFFVAKKYSLPVYLAIIFPYQLTIFICSSQDQIFDDKIDYKCCVKNLLRFLSSNITGGRIDKRLSYLQATLFFGFRFFLNEK